MHVLLLVLHHAWVPQSNVPENAFIPRCAASPEWRPGQKLHTDETKHFPMFPSLASRVASGVWGKPSVAHLDDPPMAHLYSRASQCFVQHHGNSSWLAPGSQGGDMHAALATMVFGFSLLFPSASRVRSMANSACV